MQTINFSTDLVTKLIAQQFPQYARYAIREVGLQGHDNRTYRLGDNLLVRMPSAYVYAVKVEKEHALLLQLASYIQKIQIPIPIAMGKPSHDYPYPFSIYRWLPGKSLNLLHLNEVEMQKLAIDLASFLMQLQAITVLGPKPGQHNFWRGDHIHVYSHEVYSFIPKLGKVIDSNKAIYLWELACATSWTNPPVWVHGDVAVGNILIQDGMLSGIIDFGGMAVGDPACDLGIAWTYFSDTSREIFMQIMNLDDSTWLRARAWVLWKALSELSNLPKSAIAKSLVQQNIINSVL